MTASTAAIMQLYVAVVLQLAAVALLLWSSWRLAAWLWPEPDWAERLLTCGLVFCSLAVVIVIALGLVGVLCGPLLGAAVVGVGAVVRWKVPPGEPLPRLEWPRELAWPLGLACLVTLPFLARAVLWVPLCWDELTYHLFYPAEWIRTGRVYLIDGIYPYNYLGFYPKNHELICTFLMGIARNDIFVKLLNFPLAALTGVATGLLCVQVGGSRLAAWCVGMFVFTIPAMFCWVATTYVEPLLNFAMLSAVYFVVCAFKADGRHLWRCVLLAGLALGMALGTKYTAVYLAVLLTPIVMAVPLARRLGVGPMLSLPALFAGGCLLTGVWWYACNAAVTGNPVYPVPLGSLNAIVDADRPSLHESSILTEFGWILENGYFPIAWFGALPSPENIWEVGPEMGFPPTQMGFGLKLLVIVPLSLLGLAFAWGRGRNFVARKDWAGAATLLSVAAVALVLLYTYLKLPIWRDMPNLFCQIRFAIPFVCVALALGFAALDETLWARHLVALTVIGVLCDALILDLRLPNLDRLQSFVVLAAIGAAFYLLRGVRVEPRVAWRLAALLCVLGLFPLAASREKHRYQQWGMCYEVHGSLGPAFAEPAYRIEQKYAGQTIAYAGNFASFLYMFVGPRLDNCVCYVSTHDGPALSYLKQGTLRDVFDRDAWERNLKSSGAKVLVSFRFHDRQLDSSAFWPQEHEWAEQLGFPVLHQNPYCCVHEVVFKSGTGYTGNQEVSQGK